MLGNCGTIAVLGVGSIVLAIRQWPQGKSSWLITEPAPTFSALHSTWKLRNLISLGRMLTHVCSWSVNVHDLPGVLQTLIYVYPGEVNQSRSHARMQQRYKGIRFLDKYQGTKIYHKNFVTSRSRTRIWRCSCFLWPVLRTPSTPSLRNLQWLERESKW